MPGIYQGTELADKTFYGLRLDLKTGHFSLEIIRDGSPVVLPQEGVIDPNDYRAWVWSDNHLELRWAPQGHIQLVIL
jgi:hypothetical protein